MSDEERKRIIDEALHGAKTTPAPVEAKHTPVMPPAVSKVTPCCAHCVHKMGTVGPTTQPTPANPYSGYGLTTTTPVWNPYMDQLRAGSQSQLNQNYLFGFGGNQLAQALNANAGLYVSTV